MLTLTEIAWFALASLLLALTPGPNMIYCVSRTLIQGRRAGLISLGGVLMAFLVHLCAAALGLTALLLAVARERDALRLAGDRGTLARDGATLLTLSPTRPGSSP